MIHIRYYTSGTRTAVVPDLGKVLFTLIIIGAATNRTWRIGKTGQTVVVHCNRTINNQRHRARNHPCFLPLFTYTTILLSNLDMDHNK
ncbi:hypothetical protein AB833_14310 [Chromatiales bacterium (ex Bugula neritina AB1)]|nr:hypothetical protein AB833_14310 [Chromatiales bacterium (ex Bugula neritina AB1)]